MTPIVYHRGMSDTKSVPVRVNVTPALHVAITAEAERRDVSVAHVVRRAIRAYLSQPEAART